jgi:translation elongation factor EF-Tu-like GTPase
MGKATIVTTVVGIEFIQTTPFMLPAKDSRTILLRGLKIDQLEKGMVITKRAPS